MDDRMKVLVLDGLARECLTYLEEEGLAVEAAPAGSEAGLAASIADFDALITGPSCPIGADALRAGKRLHVIGCAGATVDAVAVDEATRRGVVVVYAPDSDAVSESELALTLLLACARVLPRVDADLRAGTWDEAAWADASIEVRGKTLGLVGLTQASALLAESAAALGMAVLACEPRDARSGATPALQLVDRAQVCAASDLLVLDLDGRAGTVVGAAEMAQLRPGSRLVSMGGLQGIDREALGAALRDGHVTAAALAVSAAESPAARELAATGRVLLAPRQQAPTADARLRAQLSVAEQVAAALHGEFPEHAVNVVVTAREDAVELMPYLGLCRQLGRLLVQLAEDEVEAVEVAYGGSLAYFDTRLLTQGVLGGVLEGRVEGAVNFVNAQTIAAELGVDVGETREPGVPDFPRLVIVSASGPHGRTSVAGTSLGSEHKARLVRLFGEDVDIEPAAHMAFLRYVDAPGVGGRVGTMLGEWGVNIGHMSVGRGRLGNEAVMALALDEPLTAAQADELVARGGLSYARAAEL